MDKILGEAGQDAHNRVANVNAAQRMIWNSPVLVSAINISDLTTLVAPSRRPHPLHSTSCPTLTSAHSP